MKAVIYKKYGPPNVLQLSEVDEPGFKDNEILVRCRAVEVTKADCELRSFKFPVKWFWPILRLAFGVFRPRRKILGTYFAGEVEAIGSGVTRFRPGDKIFGTSQFRLGAYGQYLALPETHPLVAMAANQSFAEAASMLLGGFNALHFLSQVELHPGKEVLVVGAGGSIGLFALQMARAAGATVTAVDQESKFALIRSAGADHCIDFMHTDFTREEKKYDVIFHVIVTKNYGGCLKRLKKGGSLLLANPRFTHMVRAKFNKQVIADFAGETGAELQQLKEMIEQGKIKAVVDRVIPMSAAAEGHRLVESEERLGCIVMELEEG